MPEPPSNGSEQAFLEKVAANFHRRTQFAATVTACVGLLTGIILSIFVLGPPGLEIRRWVVGLLMPLGSAAFFAGAAYAGSAFFAPSGYFETKYGAQVLAILQTRSVGFARVIAVVLISLCLAMCFVAVSHVAIWLDLVRAR